MVRLPAWPSLIAALLLLQLILAPVQAGPNVNTAQQASIVQEFGPGAPFGDWERRAENANFYLHLNPGFSSGSGATPANPQGTAVFPADLLYPTANPDEAPDRAIIVGSNDRTAELCVYILIGTACTGPGSLAPAYQFATFKTWANATFAGSPAVDDMRVYSIQGNLYISGLPSGGLGYARVYEVDATGARVAGVNPRAGFTLQPASPIISTQGSTPGPILYEGRVSFGVDGFALAAGHAFEFEVGTATIDATNQADPQNFVFGVENIRGNLVGTPGALLLDSRDYPSSFTLNADSARLNVWTEDRFGNPADVFGPANLNTNTPANVADRQFLVQVVQANAWGRNQFDLPGYPNFCNERSIFGAATGHHALRIKNLTTDYQLRLRTGLQVDLLTGAQATGSESALSGFRDLVPDGSVIAKTWHYVYPSGYADANKTQPLTPDGRYQIELYNDCQPWSKVFRTFTIGQRGFTFGLAPGEVASHSVRVGQATDFSFLVKNVGSSSAIVQFAVSSLSGFTGTFSPASLPLGPGEEKTITLRLSPPGNVGAGDLRNFTVTAASLTSNDIKTQSISIAYTSVATRGVTVQSLKPVVETRPSFTQAVSVAVRNTGNGADNFLVRATGAPLGWSVSVSPPTLNLLSASRGDVLVTITAPADAAAGTAFTLQIEAISIADATVKGVLDLPVRIFFVNGAEVEFLQGALPVSLRNRGADNCAAVDCVGIFAGEAIYTDTDVDRTSLARARITNTGDLPTVYTLNGYWDPAVRTSDCGNSPDGVPDAWRFNVDHRTLADTTLPDLGQGLGGAQTGDRRATGFSGFIRMGTLALEPQQSKDVVVEVGYLTDEGACSGTQSSNTARFVIQATDNNDPTFVSVGGVSFERIGAGAEISQNRFTNGLRSNDVRLETNERARHFAPAGTTTVYEVIARNTGNEMDTITVKVDEGVSGWVHGLAFTPVIGSAYIFNGANPNGDAGGGTWAGFGLPESSTNEAPTLAGCPTSNSPRQVTCTLGVNDEVHVLVSVTSPANALQGRRDVATVTVISGDDGSKFDELALETFVGGAFAYEVSTTTPQAQILRGGQALLPFSIHNVGENADTYRFTVLEGDSTWLPAFSDPTGQAFLLPNGVQHGFLRVQAPATATIGAPQRFLIRFENVGDTNDALDSQFRTLEFFAVPVAATSLSLDAPGVLVPRGQTVGLQVTARDTTGTATSVNISVDASRLPNGWTVTGANGNSSTATFSQGNATAFFTVAAPDGELSTSRVSFRLTGRTNGNVTAFVDTEAVLASVFGVTLNTTGPLVAAAGTTVTHTVELSNTGLDADTYTLTTSTAPSGWTVTLPVSTMGVAPLETKEVAVLITIPANAASGATGTVLLFATSAGDSSKTAQATLQTQIGVLQPQVLQTAEGFLAPEETGSFLVTVLNNGTLRDTVSLKAVLAPEFRDQAKVEFENGTLDLRPGESKDVRVSVTMPRALAAGTQLVVTVQAVAVDGNTSSQQPLRITVLPYSAQDVDGDALLEYAVDRNRDEADGLEDYRESTSAGGIATTLADLERFLSEAARQRMSRTLTTANATTLVFSYSVRAHCVGNSDNAGTPLVDGDCDGRRDFFLDNTADGMPDVYWDPDNRVVSTINVTKDVTKDQVRESFVDLTGDGRFDAAFDVVEGRFIKLLQRDVDGDGRTDYVVDLDGDGQADPNEQVLYARTGGLVSVQRIDLDGDGRLDEVYDTDGDGLPDSFLPAGATKAIPITLKDVNGDGVLDWTFDSDGDGRDDTYYDPVTQTTGTIDRHGVFVRALLDHWYIGALFGVVLVLFVVLLGVTRK